MRTFTSVFITLVLTAACSAAFGQAIVLKDGVTKLGPDQFKIEGGKVMKIVKVGGNVATSELQLSQVLRLEWPEPEELKQGNALLAAGKVTEALDMLKKGKDIFEPFKEVPGNWFTELSFAYVDALSQAGKFEDTIKAKNALSAMKLSPEQKTRLKIIQLNIDRQTSSNYDDIIGQAKTILDEMDDSATGASLWIIIGDVYSKKKEWEKALFAYLRVPVFYGTQVQRVPEAELASARCLKEMRRFEDAAKYYQRLMDTYPGSNIAEVAKSEEAKIKGMKNEDENAGKQDDKKGDKSKSGDAAKPADDKAAK